jgi:hypothetical protein
MQYQMHRVFCATPLDLEEEREAFHQVLVLFNDQEAMKREVLLVGVSIVPLMSDKRAYQRAVDENIRDSRYYILLWDGGWGPPQRNFESDWKLALECAGNPKSPMQAAVALQKSGEECSQQAVGLRNSDGSDPTEYRSIDEFKAQIWQLLVTWLSTIAAPAAAQAAI